MSTTLRQRLSELATSFASDVLSAIRGASLEDLGGGSTTRAMGDGRGSPARGAKERSAVAKGGRRGERLPRRSADDISGVVERIVGLLRQNAKGLRAEEIRQKLGLQAKELPRPLKEALDSGRISKSGQKRATTYFAKGSAGSAKAGKAAGRRAAAQRPRRAKAARKGRGKAPKRARAGDKKGPAAAPAETPQS
jgi:hypothetical protein